MYKARAFKTHISKWTELPKTKVRCLIRGGNSWSPSFTAYKHQLHRGRALNMRSENVKHFGKIEDRNHFLKKITIALKFLILENKKDLKLIV